MPSTAAEVAHGPMYIGFMFNIFLFGVVTAQIYMYMTTFKNDKLWMKLFVAFLYFFNVMNTVFIAVYLYSSLILNFADTHYLEVADWVFATDPALTGIIATLVQLFFAWRVKVLTSSWWLALLVIMCTLAGLGTDRWRVHRHYGRGPEPSKIYRVPSVQGISPRLAGRAMFGRCGYNSHPGRIPGNLKTKLLAFTHPRVPSQKKHKSGFKASDDLVDRIIRMTIQTGVLTSLCALVDLVMFLTDVRDEEIFSNTNLITNVLASPSFYIPQPTGLHLIFNFPLAKLYTNTLMSSLNSRSGWAFDSSQPRSHSQPNTPSSNGLAISTIGGTRTKTNNIVRLGSQRPEVFVHVESHELQDRHAVANRNLDDNWPEVSDREGKLSSTDDASSGWEPK
ncbi:hypothetical protein VNI00_005919 [Paramarasmius palmivorus]|uniref:DUF6534 domain-containing protein n=1 Tax=Paramarasmius palmivorus TaxID=297713 RepID=A0AAW0DE60_9AGAR